jgi:hypothetical protein
MESLNNNITDVFDIREKNKNILYKKKNCSDFFI